MKKWLENAVFYEIYPQSFNDTNADGIGDLNGITEKLDYINGLGFNAIWINPCFKSPFTDAGYDVEDFYNVAPRYGTNEDMKRLFDEAHRRDIHVILDLVPGHTSLTCAWFKESMKQEKNKYSGRYIWTDEAWKGFDNIPGISGTLRGLSDRNGSCAVNYYSTQPALNYGFAKITEKWQNPVDSENALSTREEMLNIIRFWLKMGCDGFRVDMAASLIKNDDGNTETIKLWQKMFEKLNKEFPDAAFVSEWGEPDKALLAGFDMDFLLPIGNSNYNELFRTVRPYFSHNGNGDSTHFFNVYMSNCKKNNGKGLMCLPSGNHDLPRISNRLDETEIKLAFSFIMSMPGAPFIYYGDEIGMRYLDGINSVEGGYERTGTRSPMQWDKHLNCGFSSAPPDKLYIPLDPSEDRPTVKDQMNNSNSILNELKRQIAARKSNKSLQASAAFEPINITYPLVYKRNGECGSILVAINSTDKELSLPISLKTGKIIYSYNGVATTENEKLTVPACSATYAEII